MELVNGLPITDYCDHERLSLSERLKLFLPVCLAVQHAHQKGIIHRDLKPSNVLVAQHDGRPVPKVIDFGLAKAVGPKLAQITMFTQYGQMLGTVDYMSPEQAAFNQADVDTRSDIYSLGVLLYELVTGETPFDRQRLRSAAFDELLRIIRKEEPPRPSTRLSSHASLPTIATNRSVEPTKLDEPRARRSRLDRDEVPRKGAEPSLRVADALAADIERFLNHDAISARPPSAVYRLRKLVRRNAAAVTAIAAVALALVIGGVVSTIFGIQATRQAARAVDAREELRGTLYAAEMNLVQSAWNTRRYDHAWPLLEQQRPKVGEKSPRLGVALLAAAAGTRAIELRQSTCAAASCRRKSWRTIRLYERRRSWSRTGYLRPNSWGRP